MRLSVPADAFCFGVGYQRMERSNAVLTHGAVEVERPVGNDVCKTLRRFWQESMYERL